MGRLRIIAAVLGCLAVVAASVTNVAAARDFSRAVAERSIANAPCNHCHDCDDQASCPMPMTDCLQAHAGASALVLAAFVELPHQGNTLERWIASVDALSGLSPPPDPFPPRP